MNKILSRQEKITLSLSDYRDEDSPSLRVTITVEKLGIGIAFEGYGEYTSEKGGSIVFIEQTSCKPRMLIWDDINVEDSVETITFEGAREDLRRIED